MSDEARRLLRLFAGSPEAHGTYRPERTSALAGKVEIKSSARTIREPVTEAMWDEHLAGRTPLGIIPLRGDDTVVWACGDVDEYNVVHGKLAEDIRSYRLPLVVTRSKSGGAHVFLFLSAPTEPAVVQVWMRAQMARLGHGACEVFPKQARILRERGDLGNWIVMPYFGQSQEAIRHTGTALTLAEFVREAERQLVDPAALVVAPPRHANGSGTDPDSPVGDGPPCLQHLVAAGFPEGTRNRGLFALGIYCRKRWPAEWQQHLEEFNRSAMRPPLPAEEVVEVVRSLEKRDYQYSCQDVPLVNHCNAPLCRTRLHGIGGAGGDIPTISGLSVLETDPPIWFIDIGEERLELSTDELITYRLFQKKCIEHLHQVWRSLKQDTWLRMLSDAMASVSRIEVSEETRPRGHFREMVEEFCTNRRRGTRPEDLFSSRPWDSEEDKKYYFRMQDLESHIRRAGVQMSRSQLTSRIRDLGGDKRFLNVKGKGVNTWWVPHDAVSAVPRVDSPPLRPEVM